MVRYHTMTERSLKFPENIFREIDRAGVFHHRPQRLGSFTVSDRGDQQVSVRVVS